MPTVGDLLPEEIVEQLLYAHSLEVSAGRAPVRNVVFMGMGEPLNNYSAVLVALRTMTDEALLGRLALQSSKVTVSTVGVAPMMRRLAHDAPGVSLALSLHAPTQELREQIVPAARHHPLPDLLEALDAHTSKCHRPTASAVGAMIEYVLLRGVNDGQEQALELGRLMAPRRKDVMVNLIPYNPGVTSTPEGFRAPAHEDVERFQQIVAAFGVTTRVRREMGRDIAGACGQLALTKQAGKAACPDIEEDFVAWRRRQPESAKQEVNASCLALVQAAASSVDATSGSKAFCLLGGIHFSHHRWLLLASTAAAAISTLATFAALSKFTSRARALHS